MDAERMINRLKNAGIAFEHGMSENELHKAEEFFHFTFPKEIWDFLSCGVPRDPSFFNYRDLSEQNLKRFLKFQESIERSFRYDLKYNRKDMIGMLCKKLSADPCSESFDDAVIKYWKESIRLIPFYAHRCFFDGMDNMPIVSFWQPVDTIFYGGCLENYLEHEFLDGERVMENIQDRMKRTGIWNDLIW